MSVPSEEKQTYTFGDFTLDIGRGALLEGGAEIKLRAQSFEVLRILVARHGQLVTREELQSKVWGHKVVTDDSLTHCMIDIRKALGDADRSIIRTIPRRGFIFDEKLIRERGTAQELTPTGSRRQILWVAASAGVLAILVSMSIWLLNEQQVPSSVQKNSIAVLPFMDMSETQDMQYLGDGLSDEVLNLLARTPELRVIARTSTFSFASQNPDIATIRDMLNVAFVLEGSVRRTGDRLRVTARLIDTADSTNVWSESFDRRPEDLLAVQKDIAEAILAKIAPAAKKGLATPARRNFSADELMLLARYYEQEVHEQPEVDRKVLAEAISLYREATLADPDSALAHSRLASALLYNGEMDAAEAPIFRALTLDPNLSSVQETLGRFYWYRGLTGAGTAWKRATELNPNNADAWASYAYWTWMQGNDNEPEFMYRRALELDPLSLARHAALGEFVAHMARLEKTQDIIDLIRMRFNSPDAFRVIARLLELTGKVDESIAWTIKARNMEPSNLDHVEALAELYAEIGDFETARQLDKGSSIGLLYKMRRFDELIDEAELLMIDEPNDIYLRYILAFAYNATSNPEAAIRMLRIIGQPGMAMPEARQAIDVEAFISYMDALNSAGQSAEARRLAEWFDRKPHTENRNWWVNVYRACSLAILEHHERALQKLETVTTSPRLPWNTALRDLQCFERYDNEPRYRAVLEQVESRRTRLREQLPNTLRTHNVVL